MAKVKHWILNWPPRIRVVAIVAVLVLIAAIGVAFLKGSPGSRASSKTSTDVPRWFINQLNEIEADLKRPIPAQELNRLAAEIQQRISEHPLPPEDEFQFGAELIIRDLRSLSALQYNRELRKVRKDGPAIDTSASQNEAEAIVAENNYKARIWRTIIMLRQQASKRTNEVHGS